MLKPPTWWMDAITVTLLRETTITKHRARDLAAGWWEVYCSMVDIEIEQARREEREACAQICDDLSTTGKDDWSITRSKAFFDAGRAIRSREEGK